MSKGTNQKMKLVYLMKILLEKTDNEHSLTMPEILTELEKYGVTAQRKSIYDDLNAIRDLGFDIAGEQRGKTYYYYVAKREFDLPELKLLVDAIQSSKFITAKKSNDLIKKLERYVSEHQAKQLQRQVYVSGRIKTMNESIYDNVDLIHEAITNNKQIKFKYFMWNAKKQMEYKHDGAYYQVSPWGLCWDDENYYLIAYDVKEQCIKHFRVDKIDKLKCLSEKREGRDVFKQLDMAVYTTKHFGMFNSDEKSVRLEFTADMINVIIDRFGKDIMIIPAEDGKYRTNVNVNASPQFFGWIFALEGVKILGPESVVEEARKMVERLKSIYQ